MTTGTLLRQMTRGTPPLRCRRPRRRPAQAAVVVAVLATLLGLASSVAATVVAEPTSAQASSTVSPRPAGPTPTTHSYDDPHTGQRPEGANPALWILAGAVAGLIAIAIVMLRAGKPPRHHLSRGP